MDEFSVIWLIRYLTVARSSSDTGRHVMYGVKIVTDKNDFLFFNKGDQAAYSFDEIAAILANDIYGVGWFDRFSAING